MVRISVQHVLYLAQTVNPLLPQVLRESQIDYTHHNDPFSAVKDARLANPDLIISELDFPHIKGAKVIKVLHDKWPQVPAMAVFDLCSVQLVQELLDAGLFYLIDKRFSPAELAAALSKAGDFLTKQKKQQELWERLATSETHLLEKNTVLETLLDTLSHDSKNLFINLYNLINQLNKSAVKTMLKACTDELFQGIQESLGYLKEKKRIRNLLTTVLKLNLTKERIPIASHPCIEIEHDTGFLLFAETSSLLKNALMNIIENALKYSRQGTMVTIKLTRRQEKIIIRISDRGPGIADGDKVNIFKKYYRGLDSHAVEGSGRGLWITKNIIEKESGRIYLEDNPGGGSIFTVELPAYRVKNLQSGLNSLAQWYDLTRYELVNKTHAIETLLKFEGLGDNQDLDSLIFVTLLDYLRKEEKSHNKHYFKTKLTNLKKKNPRGKSVLIVDDSIHVHLYMASNLTESGYRIAGYAGNGLEAVALYKELTPDLVTMDFTMPLMSGLQAAREIYQYDKNAKILFFTGLGDCQSHREKLRGQFPRASFKILSKPLKKKELNNMLKELWGQA